MNAGSLPQFSIDKDHSVCVLPLFNFNFFAYHTFYSNKGFPLADQNKPNQRKNNMLDQFK